VAVTDRATQAEKAQAWDRLMKSTKTDPLALMDAWEWLEQQVKEREERAREAGLTPLLSPVNSGSAAAQRWGDRARSRANGHFPGDAA
jgi:hypothetical protein